MPPAPSQQGQNPDNHMAAMWISFGIFILVMVLWFIFKTEIIKAFFYVKTLEIDFIDIFSNKLDPLKEWMQTINLDKVTFHDISKIASAVGSFFLLPVSALMIVFGVILLNRSVGSRFKTVHSMTTLLKKEIKVWPQATPIMQQDLMKQDINKGEWAMAKTPMQFAKDHKLIKVQRKALEEGMLRKSAKLQAVLIKARANQLFVRQLGPMWQGVERLPMHTRALFVIIAARIANEPKVSQDLLMQIARSANGGKLNFSGVNKLVEKYKTHKVIVQTIERHAYVLTVLASMLEIARTTGVLASSDFLWLKIIDRRLWFMLNGVGRQTPTTEVAGPFAHWKYEKALERPFRTPMIEEATKALGQALQEQIYIEDEQSDG